MNNVRWVAVVALMKWAGRPGHRRERCRLAGPFRQRPHGPAWPTSTCPTATADEAAPPSRVGFVPTVAPSRSVPILALILFAPIMGHTPLCVEPLFYERNPMSKQVETPIIFTPSQFLIVLKTVIRLTLAKMRESERKGVAMSLTEEELPANLGDLTPERIEELVAAEVTKINARNPISQTRGLP